MCSKIGGWLIPTWLVLGEPHTLAISLQVSDIEFVKAPNIDSYIRSVIIFEAFIVREWENICCKKSDF